MKRLVATLVVCILGLTLASPAAARPYWKRRIDRLAPRHAMGVAVRFRKHNLYGHNATIKRVPASNEKLLLSMAALDTFGAGHRFDTRFEARRVGNGVVEGNLWVLGSGDPTISGRGAYGRSLKVEPTRLKHMVAAIKDEGIRRIEGRVMGGRSFFARDWWAPGWRSDFARLYIPLPTALTFEGNVSRGRHTANPELRLATALTRALRTRGVRVGGRPGARKPPADLDQVARVQSTRLAGLLRHTNRVSSNFFAEVLGKALGGARSGPLGTIDKGARALRNWALAHGVRVRAQDSSGLSYRNWVSPRGLTRLLAHALKHDWGRELRYSLPRADQGTLKDRLRGVRVRAKTGTLDYVSALSGWVWLRKRGAWAEFSIMSRGLSKTRAVAIEGKIVRTITRLAR